MTTLLRKYPDEWSSGLKMYPFRSVAKVFCRAEVMIMPTPILEVKDLIEQMRDRLPKQYQACLDDLIVKLGSEEEKFNLPRLIEYLAIASCQYVVSRIAADIGGEHSFSIEGITLLPKLITRRNKTKSIRTEIWFFHNNEDIDPLLHDCVVSLAVPKLKSILFHSHMDLFKVLEIKKETYKSRNEPSDTVSKKSKRGRFMAWLDMFSRSVMSHID